MSPGPTSIRVCGRHLFPAEYAWWAASVAPVAVGLLGGRHHPGLDFHSGECAAVPKFAISPNQAQAARAFRAFAYRFAVCHELSHVVLGHVDAGPTERRNVGEDEPEVFRTSQAREIVADRFGLSLQIKSLLDRTQLVTSLSAAVYLINILGLLDARLMLLAPLVDERSWKIRLTHPPTLERVFNLMDAAESLYKGGGRGLEKVHYSLGGLDGQVRDTANRQQEEVAGATIQLLDREAGTAASAAAIQELLQLFERSPLGVLRVVDERGGAGTGQFVSAFPPEFQRFLTQTRQERAAELA